MTSWPSRNSCSLGEDVRAKQLDGLDAHRPGVDGHVIDAAQAGDRLGPQVLGERRAVRALVDVLVGRERDHQDVAVLLGGLEVTNMPDVQQVKDAVAVNNSPAAGAHLVQQGSQLFQSLDLLGGASGRPAVAARPMRLAPARRLRAGHLLLLPAGIRPQCEL